MKINSKNAVKTAPAPKSAPKAVPAKRATQKAAPKNQRVLFSVRAEPGSKVFLAGSFNNWDPTAKEMIDKKGDGVFTATLLLPPGEYQYKFVIDGTWCADPECPDWVQNDHGTLNSVKRVG
ncbi:MAG TPA: glycogen-binding domain-containing protein [Kiritimatiellia bacterium]|nr:glycogen-binding domain-containing protein [Kiritimatiellia bacterium]HRU70118.1 glycogen-binding domain-containing protein [Kiritimatiellia bacterium]